MISSLNITDLLFHVERLVEQTDPWNPRNCVAAITTREANKGRAAFFELRKRLAGASKNGATSEWIPSRPIVGFNEDGSTVTVDSWSALPSARLRLTDAEREAVAWAERFARSQRDSRDNAADYAATLRGLLERTQ